MPDAELAGAPNGLTLLRTLRGHTGAVGQLSWSVDGELLATPSADHTVGIWKAADWQLRVRLEGHAKGATAAAFRPKGDAIASGGPNGVRLRSLSTPETSILVTDAPCANVAFNRQGTVLATAHKDRLRLWGVSDRDAHLAHEMPTADNFISQFCFNAAGDALLSFGNDQAITLWDTSNAEAFSFNTNHSGGATSAVFAHHDRLMATGGAEGAVNIWDTMSNRLVASLEGHTSAVVTLSFMAGNRLLASRAVDGTVRFWDCKDWRCIAWVGGLDVGQSGSISFHPRLPLLAVVASERGNNRKTVAKRLVQIWQLDADSLATQAAGGDVSQATINAASVAYVTAKIVLVGEQGVGKTGLGWRLAHHEFKEHASTHGQQFWHIDDLSGPRTDETQCEAILWDLAGQPDYRLIHALFVEDADVALVLFDPAADGEPLRGVEYWLRQLGVLGAGVSRGPRFGRDVILVAARSDRGTPRLTTEELAAFCTQRGIQSYIATSARTGQGLPELLELMRGLVRWDNRTTTITTTAFKQVRDYVLGIREAGYEERVILRPEELRARLQGNLMEGELTDNEMIGIVGHLANHGYVARLVTSKGEPVILLAPELLNNVAASMVLAARSNPAGLGALEEDRLRSADYRFSELAGLSDAERAILLDSATAMFLRHNICFRDTDQLASRAYLIFPQLINLKKPDDYNEAVEDGVTYSISGAVENLYASLVVRLGYTRLFARVNQWHNHARYAFGDGQVCGFRMHSEQPGSLDYVLYFGKTVEASVRMLFQGLFESFIARANVKFVRHELVRCDEGHLIHQAVIKEQRKRGSNYIFCNQCGLRASLPVEDDEDRQRPQQANVYAQQRNAAKRTRFEQAMYLLKSHVKRDGLAIPDCFISYAWGDQRQERWIVREFAEDLVKAGIEVVLDRWENARIGASVPRFVERVAQTSRVIVVGTPGWRRKYDNNEPMGGFVAASEGDLIGHRMVGSEGSKLTVLPVLLVGDVTESLPPLLQGRVYADFRDQSRYFETMLDLLVSLYQIPHRHPLVNELRDLLGIQGAG